MIRQTQFYKNNSFSRLLKNFSKNRLPTFDWDELPNGTSASDTILLKLNFGDDNVVFEHGPTTHTNCIATSLINVDVTSTTVWTYLWHVAETIFPLSLMYWWERTKLGKEHSEAKICTRKASREKFTQERDGSGGGEGERNLHRRYVLIGCILSRGSRMTQEREIWDAGATFDES